MTPIAVTGGDFALQQVKLAGGGLKVKYLWTPAKQEGSIERTESHGRLIHPDLVAALDVLRGVICDALDHEEMPSLAQSLAPFLHITGVKIAGEGFKEGIIVDTSVTFVNGEGSLTSPKLSYTDTVYGEVLEQALDKIQQEVAEYLFYGKEAQLSIFGEDPEGIFEEIENDGSED